MKSFKNRIKDDYFEWLYAYVSDGRAHGHISYRELFTLLHSIEFTFSVPNDINRARDGVDLRYRYSTAIDDESVMDILDGPCSVLEMLIALAIKCEENIMDDPRYGDRTKQWFWTMLSNLGLSHMTDDIFIEEFVVNRVYDFLERRYEPNGLGGLFYIKDCKEDLRTVEIWNQLCWYLTNYT